jgi:hypothetical protein
MRILHLLKRLKEFWDWLGLFWQIASLLGVAGFAISIGGTVWAMLLGLPAPFIRMGAFCTLVGAVYLTMSPLAYQALKQVPPKKHHDDQTPNLAAVRLQHRYTLGPASRLWVNLDPNANATYSSSAWYETFKSAIQQGKLRFEPQHDDLGGDRYEKENPGWDTVVTRKEFKRYATSIGQDPPFLHYA